MKTDVITKIPDRLLYLIVCSVFFFVNGWENI